MARKKRERRKPIPHHPMLEYSGVQEDIERFGGLEDEDEYCFITEEMEQILEDTMLMMYFIVGLERLLSNPEISKRDILNFLINSGMYQIANGAVGTITGYFMEKGYGYFGMYEAVHDKMLERIGHYRDWPSGIEDLMEER